MSNEIIFHNRVNALVAVRHDGLALGDVSGLLRDDEEVVLAAVRNNPAARQFASGRLREDRTILFSALSRHGPSALVVASPVDGHRRDRVLIRSSVARTGWTLRHASRELRDDPDVVRAAVRNDGLALCLASADLRNDPGIISLAIFTDRRALVVLPVALRPRYLRAGPAETRILFRHMPYPFALPEDLVEERILPLCHLA